MVWVGIVAGCGGSDNSAIDSGMDASQTDGGSDASTTDSGAKDTGATDASDAGSGDAGSDAQCTALPDASFGCGGGLGLKCDETEYCLGGSVQNSCAPNPSECDCLETHDCTCLKAHFVSPCDGGGGTWSCSNINDAGDLWMLGSCL